MIICLIIQNTLPTPTPNAEFTRRLYSVHTARPQRAHGTLEDPTALPPSRGVCFEHCTARTSAICIFLNAVGTL